MPKKPKFDPFKNLVLDEYEQEIEDNIGKLDLTPPSEARLVMLQKVAENTLRDLENQKKSKNINLRVTEATFRNLKSKATRLGLPYQTLASSILHQYSSK